MNLLIADDAPHYRDRLAAGLSARGATAVTCGSCEKAIELSRLLPLDGLVIDCQLSGGGGFGVAANLHRINSRLAIVMLTHAANPSDEAQALSAGARACLIKPADPAQVLAIVRGATPRPDAPSPPLPSLARAEWDYIQWVLSSCAGNISQAARLLGIDRRSLQRKLAKHPPSR